jgi:predicted anti-sigma-YlaC factor YlaD
MTANHLINTKYDCESIRKLIPDYAFGLTSAEETRMVESNLDRCPQAAAELADFRRLQDEMRMGVAQIEPPMRLGDQLMAAIAAPQKPEKVTRPPLRLSWAVAAVAVVALIVTNVYWLVRVNSTPAPAGNGSESTSVEIPVQGDSTFALTSADNLRWVRLPPAQEDVNASAVVMWNVESEIGLLYVRGFPELAVGKTFQLWLTKGEDRASAGTFQVDENGNGAMLFNITEAIDQYTWARITEEPADGSSEPSDQVVVVGEL